MLFSMFFLQFLIQRRISNFPFSFFDVCSFFVWELLIVLERYLLMLRKLWTDDNRVKEKFYKMICSIHNWMCVMCLVLMLSSHCPFCHCQSDSGNIFVDHCSYSTELLFNAIIIFSCFFRLSTIKRVHSVFIVHCSYNIFFIKNSFRVNVLTHTVYRLLYLDKEYFMS